MLRLDMCDYSDPYIVVKGKIVVANPSNDTYDKKVAFKNNPPFTGCILKINDTLIDNAEDLDIVMPMNNLLEYSKNYRKTTGSLWNYYRDEPACGAVGNINYSINDSKSFDCKTSISGKLEGNNVEKDDVKIIALLKFLSDLWKTPNILPFISCEISLTLTWSENCVKTSKATREVNTDVDPTVGGVNNPTNAILKITDCSVMFQQVLYQLKMIKNF